MKSSHTLFRIYESTSTPEGGLLQLGSIQRSNTFEKLFHSLFESSSFFDLLLESQSLGCMNILGVGVVFPIRNARPYGVALFQTLSQDFFKSSDDLQNII